jgi:hypothetical protein
MLELKMQQDIEGLGEKVRREVRKSPSSVGGHNTYSSLS